MRLCHQIHTDAADAADFVPSSFTQRFAPGPDNPCDMACCWCCASAGGCCRFTDVILSSLLSALRQALTVHLCDVCLLLPCLQEVAADAADIVASSPSTLKQQLAQEGADLEADWAEAEAAGAGALTTTGVCWSVCSAYKFVSVAGPLQRRYSWCLRLVGDGRNRGSKCRDRYRVCSCDR